VIDPRSRSPSVSSRKSSVVSSRRSSHSRPSSCSSRSLSPRPRLRRESAQDFEDAEGASPNINVELVDHQNRTHCRRQLFLTVSHAPVSHNRVIHQRSAPGTPCKHRRGSRSCSRSPSRTNSNDSGGLQVFLAIKASTVQILL